MIEPNCEKETKFVHSVKVPRFYRLCVSVLKDLESKKSSLNQLTANCKHPNKKGINGLLSKLIEKKPLLERIISESKILEKETRLDHHLAKILITERLWGSGRFVGDSKPIEVLKKYELKLQRICDRLQIIFDQNPNENQTQKVVLPRYVRVNTLKISVMDAIKRFQNEGWTWKAVNPPETYEEYVDIVRHLKKYEFVCDIHVDELLVFAPSAVFSNHPLYENGSILLQDKSTCLNSVILSAEAGSHVLDMCAAPGMKTSHLAARMNNEGVIYSIEQDEKRYAILKETLEYCGITCVKPILQDALQVTDEQCKGVEFVFVDPSCSGSGIYKRLEIDKDGAFNKKRLYRLAEFQKRLLCHALTAFPNVRLVVYSTCSIFYEENERVVQAALNMVPNFKLLSINSRLQNKLNLMPFPTYQSDVQLNDDLQRVRDKCLNLRHDTDCTNGFFIALFKRRKTADTGIGSGVKILEIGGSGMQTNTQNSSSSAVITTTTEINQSNERGENQDSAADSTPRTPKRSSLPDSNNSATTSNNHRNSSDINFDKQQEEVSATLAKAISASRNTDTVHEKRITSTVYLEDDDGDNNDNDEDEFDNRRRCRYSQFSNRTKHGHSHGLDESESEEVFGGFSGDEEEPEEDVKEEFFRFRPTARRLSVATNFWQPGSISRPSSPPGFITMDNSHPSNSHLSKVGSKYSNLSYWRARRVIFYKNGDPFFPGFELRFKPGRDIVSLEALLDKLSLRLDLPRGARYIFSMDGDRKLDLDELEDGASYVVSSFKTFKLQTISLACSYYLGNSVMWLLDACPSPNSSISNSVTADFSDQCLSSSSDEQILTIVLPKFKNARHFLAPASYGKKNGVWYSTPSNQTWNNRAVTATVTANANASGSSINNSRKPQILDTDMTTMSSTGSLKSGSGRVVRIINEVDHTIQCRILLNLRTSQPFEDVLEDLGQVLKISGANKMYTVSGQEVRSFSQLRNEFMDMDTFYIGVGGLSAAVSVPSLQTSPPMRRSRSKTNLSSSSTALNTSDNILPSSSGSKQRRARSKSRPRILFAPENEIIRSTGSTNDFAVVDVIKDEPIKVSIRGMRRTFYPPLHHGLIDNSLPYKKLSIDWVYGYRGIDSKRNLWVLSTGELLYYVAAVAVMYDRDEETQRHYVAHTEDITCMDVHPSREMVVSGQRAGRNRKTQAHTRIWSTETLQTLYIFGMGDFEVGVAAVAFSFLNGGSYVLTAELGRESILSVWHWQWGHLLGKVATLHEEIYGAAFHPLDDNLLITFGKSSLTFWNRRKDGFFERTDIIKPPSRTSVTCLQFEPEGDVVTGDSDGFITVYSVDSDGTYYVRMEYEAHNKGVSALIMLSEGTLLSGGEKDRRIAAWDSLQNFKKIIDCKLPDMVGSVRNLYPQRPGRNDGNIYVGTTKNIILEGSMQRRFNPIIFGHSRQIWGLAVHPDDELFATGGHDKYVILWKKHKPLWSTLVNFECISLSFHPFGYALAIGSTEGHLLIMNTETGANSTTIRICGSPLNSIGYNPVGDMIAIASQNGSVYLFGVSRDGFIYKRVNKIRGSQPLIQLDWSTDSCFLQTVTADYDLTFWDVKSLSSEKSAIAMKDVKWYSYNCLLGYSVAGIWNNRAYSVNGLITTANRSFAHDLLVSGDADGYLRLFRFPCISTKSEYHEEKMYSGPLACARFLFNDRYIATVGGTTEGALMIYKLVDE